MMREGTALSLFATDASEVLRCALAGLLSAGAARAAPPRAAGLDGAAGAWSPDPIVIGAVAFATIGYARGARVLRRGAAPRRPLRRAHVAAAGCAFATIVLALASPLDAMADVLFSAHMLQHLALTLVAAPLLAFARVDRVAPWAFGARARRTIAGPILRAGAKLGLSHPVVVLALYTAVLWTWHVPSLYQLALESELVHFAEHASFVGTAVLLFRFLRSCRERAARSAGIGLLVAFAASVQSGALGALLTFAPAAWYPIHASRAAALSSLSPLEDQQIAGLLMWVPGGLVFLGAALALSSAWLSAAESRARRHERRARHAVPFLLSIASLVALGCSGERPVQGEPSGVGTTVRGRGGATAVRGAAVAVEASRVRARGPAREGG